MSIENIRLIECIHRLGHEYMTQKQPNRFIALTISDGFSTDAYCISGMLFSQLRRTALEDVLNSGF